MCRNTRYISLCNCIFCAYFYVILLMFSTNPIANQYNVLDFFAMGTQ